MSIKRKFNRGKSKYTLSQKIVSAVTAAGFIMQPIVGFAQSIIRQDGTVLNPNNNGVIDIWADRVVDNTAVNVFKDFQLDAGKIANMYFGLKDTSHNSDNLVNFVNTRIDINGTVNAIQNNQIGGNLFFLSKDGMAVGKSGVINTGSLYVMTPTEGFMNEMLGDGSHFNEENFKTQWDNGNGNIAQMQIPVNPSGTITVLGTVNAANDVKMMAAQIGVGKNVSGDENYNVNDEDAKKALIRTKVASFEDIVNITTADGRIIDSGLDNNNLTAQVDANSGDIVLKAVASTVNSTDENFDKYEGSDNQALATVTVNGIVEARKDVSITAEATNGVDLGKLFDDDTIIAGEDNFTEAFGQITKNVATVDINGNVTGQHVDIEANTVNNYVSGTDEDINLGVITEIAGMIGPNWDGSYAVLANEATVNINEGAVVKVTSGKEDKKNALTISADSVLKASVGASTSAIKLANLSVSSNIPAASVGYLKADNKAAVNIAGELHSNGNTKISANADTTAELTAVDTTTQLKGNPTVFNIAAAIANGSSSSSVDIKDTAQMTDLNGGLDIKATSSNSIDTQALVKGKEGSFVGTAVNVTDFDSNADVKIDTAIEADDVNIAAGNSVVKNNVVANNNVGSGMIMNLLISKGTSTETVKNITDFAGKIKENLMGPEKPDVITALDKLGNWASVGVSVGVVNETNNANVTLTKNAQITAKDNSGNKGDISVTANNYIADTSMSVTGATNNYNKDVDNILLVNAAVLYSDMDSNASVILEGGDAHTDDTTANSKYTQLDGAAINVQANSEFNYGRIDKMIGDVLLLCDKLKGAYASNTTYSENVAKLKTLAEEFKKNVAANPDYADTTEGNNAAMALAAAAQQVSNDAATTGIDSQIKDIFMGPLSVVGAAAQFANPYNYANFQAGASTGGKDENGASVAVSGAVNLNYITNNASVVVGKNTVIDGSGKVDINASAAQADVAFNGKIAFTGGADNAAGGTVGVHFGEVNSLVAIAEGAEVTGSAINIGADNDVAHTAITFGAGKTSGNGLTGMASYMEGDSNSIVSIDDEAKLTATGKNEYINKASEGEPPTKDDITGISDGSVNITATNNTVLTNIAGGGTLGGENAAIGASVAITDYDVYNMAGIVNNDAAEASAEEDTVPENETEEQKRERVQKENIAKLQELTKTQSGLDDAKYKAMFGSADVNIADAGINAHDVNVDVATDGMINTVTVAGSAITGSDFDEPGIGDKLSNFVSNMSNRAENVIEKLDTAVQNKFKGTMESPNLKPTDMEASNKYAGQQRPSFTISGAGSSSVNLIDGASTALLDGAKIILSKDNEDNAGKLNVSASDGSFIGAWSGAAAISWKTFMTEQNWSNKSVGFAGAVGVNLTNTDVASIISNSTINNAGSITNTANKSGALVAAGLGMAVEKAGESGSGGNNYGGAASVSVNDSENDIYAVMQDNTVNADGSEEKTVLTNHAYDNDIQVTGGINTSVALNGQQGVVVGGTVTYASVANNVQSSIVGGKYNNMGTADVRAITDITQVGAAVGISASTGSKTNYGIEGVAAYNQLNNNADATIENAEITGDGVNVAAYDTDLGENSYTEYIDKRGLDATGSTYLENIKDTANDLHDSEGDLKVGQTGNTIVTGALGIAATTGGGGGSGSAAISISDINNDFNAAIKGSTITANGLTGANSDDVADVNVLAKSDTLLVGVAAGGAGASKGFAGAGSFTWNTVNNDNTASIENSTIDAASTKVNAISGTLGVNVAGQIGVGKTALGLAVAYNDLENNTGAYILGSDVKNTTDNDQETDVTVEAENAGKMYAIGAGVGVSSDSAAANGTIAINRGNNNLEAIIGDYESGGNSGHTNITNITNITNANNVAVTSKDTASVLSVAGGVGVSKNVAVGGAVAYNEIGNISGNEDGKIQNNTAQINNAVITTADSAKIDVQAIDEAKLTTAAVGIGVAAGGNVSVQGAAATALINKDTEASINGVTVKKTDENDNSGADVTVNASSSNNIVTTADTVSVMAGGTGAAVGAGVAVNRSEANVDALVKGGSMDVDDLAVKAANSANITTVGVGGSVAGGTGAGVTGSVAVNLLGNDTTAKVYDGALITADNNVVVDAQSDEQIANYAGSASVAGTGAAVGLSVSVNQIDGTTNASIEGSKTQVSAAGNDEEITIKNTVNDDDILNDFVEGNTFNSQTSLAGKRVEDDKKYSGVAVSASSTHSIKSFLINAGVAAQGAGVTGTVNVNQTDGSTTAAIKDAAINNSGNAGDVNVIAHDYSNSAGIVGSVGVAGEGAGVGLGSDTNTLSRDVTAEISSSLQNNKNNVRGQNVNVEAEAKQGISSMATGIAGAGIGAGVANGTTVTLVDGKTVAQISGSNITASGLNVTANHLDRINTNGISVGIAGLGAGIGIGVAVLNENSETTATVENTDVTYTNSDAATVIKADNTTEMNYQLYNIGGAVAGVAGSVGVANVNSKVNAKVSGSNLGADNENNKAGSIDVGAVNNIDFDQTAGTAGAGAVGVGVGVSVNTIDSQVQANVSESNLYAKNDIDITAEETRNVDQLAVNAGAGGAAVGANVMVTNVGKKVSNAYGTDGMEEVDVNAAYEEVQKAINGGKLSSKYTLGSVDEEETAEVAGKAELGKGGKQESLVKVDIDGGSINAGGNLTAEANETTNVNMDGINAQLSAGGSAAGTVGILNVHRNSGVEITSAALDAASVDIKAIQSGISKLDIYQGAGALGGAIGAAYGSINSEGKSGVGIGNSKITSDDYINITANDESRTEVNAIGVSIAGGGAASVIVAEGTNKAETTVTADETDVDAAKDITIHAERQAKDESGNKADSLSVSAIAASGGLVFAGAGVAAIANEMGTVGAEVTGGSTFTAGDNIAITALNAPSVSAETGAVSGSMFASAAITVAEANIGGEKEDEHLKTIVNISGDNRFTADSLTAEASVNANQKTDMDGISISASPFPNGAEQFNTGGTAIYSDVEVNVGENVFKGTGISDEENKEPVGINLNISGSNTVNQIVNAQGVSASTFFATGTNLAQSEAHLNTQVTANGASEGSDINDVTVDASSYATIDNDANGYGGALIDISPYAAMVENKYTADTDVIIGGEWNTAGSFTAQALNGMDIDLKSDAVRAAVIGGSGTWLNNVIDNDANVTVNAEITTGGAQNYTAQNNVDYYGEIDGSGYGGLNLNATDYYDNLAFTAGVDIKDSKLHGVGDDASITAYANTQGSITSKNSLKSAGVIPAAMAFSDHTINYGHSVNVIDSNLTTDKKDADITLATNDNTDVKLETIADTQGGVVGAASANASNDIERSNKVTITGTSHLLSTKDVNLYAGADLNGITSELNLQVLADAYNKTALPLVTTPKVDNQMKQYNQVIVGEGTNVESVRHVNFSASQGTTTVTESAQEYNIYQGTTGSGSVTSTLFGDVAQNDPDIENYVDVNGNVTAGIHNNLHITIGGHITVTEPVYNDDGELISAGGLNYNDIKSEVTEDWFAENSIAVTETPIKNNLLDRYNEITNLLQQYSEGTSEYDSLKNEQNNLLKEMQALGMAYYDEKNNRYIAVTQIEVPAVELPDIVVSGGNININTDTLKGGGNLTAKNAGEVSITNSSDAYLIVNDITMQDAGGQIRLNGNSLNKDDITAPVINPGGAAGNEPSITITGATTSVGTTASGAALAQPDIGVFGDITNTAGNITIKNDNYSITVLGNLSGHNISLIADKGNVTQTSTEGFINIGGDPVTKYQFSEDVAKKIQEYIYDQFVANKDYKVPEFENYEAYKDWLIKSVGISEKDLVYDEDPSAGIVAGGNIYINGLNVNIGGLIQSGYADYSTTLDESAKKKVDDLDKEWAANRTSLTDEAVMSNDAYCINNGGAVYNNDTGVWDYNVKVYYNPSTGELLTDSVNVSGGKIYITGNISSTGNGRIIAMDGTADININTAAVDRDVKVNSITNNDISGLISITDKAQGTVTEYTNGQSRTYKIGDVAGAWETDDVNYTYKSKEGLQYQWISGVSGEVTKKYQYTEDFLFWGLLDYGKTDDFVADLNSSGKEYSEIPVSSGGEKGKDSGVIVTNSGNTTGKDFSITGSYTTTDKETYTEVTPDMKYDGFWGKVFGYGTTTYTWSGTQGTASSTTTSIAADKGIEIGFIGSGASNNINGDINVTSNNNMLIAGNISNAEVDGAGKGSVTLTSNNGAISAIGSANINSDDVNITAANGVNVNHAAIGDDADINVTTTNGDIKFVSTDGNLNIKQMITGGTGGINAATGSVYLEAQGDIIDAAEGDYAIKGQRIDLISNTGNIGSKDKALTILGGSELYSSDTMASSVNAKAQGDIVLTQTEGNMRLGTIESVDGDAVLTVNNGSFVDAHPSENTDTSSAQDKIDRWVEAGLISSEDAAGESTKAAEAAKSERVDAIIDRMKSLAEDSEHSVDDYTTAADNFYKDKNIQDAKETYLEKVASAKGDQDQINNAYAEYQAVQNAYFENKGFNEAEREAIINYAELSNSDNYGWSQNQLLYAIQDSVLNAEPGEVQTVDTPNVTANNITLNAANGGIGIDADAQYINYADLNKEEKLKILAAAKAGDLTWDNTNNQVVVRQQQAITVSVKSQDEGQTYGKVNVTGRDNVYLAGVKDTELNINGVTTAGDIRLQGDEGVNVDGMLSGDNLTINGGIGNIMGNDFINDVGYVKTNVKGNVYANAMGDINIHHTGNLNLLAISTDKSANLKADGSILMYTDDDTDAQGRINASIVNLVASANIGSSDNAIRILDNGAVVNADAEYNIYLSGVDGTGSTDELVLGTIEGANLDVTSVSDINLGRADDSGTTDNEAVEGSITATDNASIEATNINLTKGTAEVKNDFNLIASNGSITQTASSSFTADSVNASATENILLGSEANKVNKFVVNGVGEGNKLNGNVTLVSRANNNKNTVNVDFAKGEQGLTVNGTVTVNTLGDSTKLNITGGSLTTTGENSGSVTFTSAGSIYANTTINSAADIVMNAHGAITNTGSLTAGNKVNVNTDAGDIELGGDVTAQKDVIVHSDKGAIEISGTVTATDNDVNIISGSGAITTTGAISGGNDVKVDTVSGDITAGGDVTGKNNVTIHSGVGTINVSGDVTATEEDVDITSGSGAITTTGAITGGTDVTVDAGTTGNIDLGGSVEAKGGNVLVTTDNGYIITTGNVTAYTDVNVNTNAGDITLGGSVQGETGKVTVTTDSGFIKTKDFVRGYKDVTLESNNGDIEVGGYTESEANNVIANVTGNGDIDFIGTVTASGDVTATVTGKGDIITGDEASVSGTDITFTTNIGNITTGNTLEAKKDIQFNIKEKGDITTNNDLTADKNVDLNVNTGNITFGGDVTANDGNITIDITGDGSLKDAENANNTLTAKGQEGSADSGNIIINLKGAGDVDLYDLYATNNARLDIANGNLTLHEINGELVAMQLRTEGREMDVDKITAGTQIVLTGSDMSLDNIAQRPDADGMLVVTPDGAQADKPIDNFTIGNIQTNAGSGIRFDRLWVNNSDIHISEGQLWFDKLYVENMAHFSNSNMVAGIYGVPPVRDGSDSVYWINTSENRPESDLQAWQAGAGDWMYLRFTNDAIQESNGILLTLDEYDYVYDQRFTAEDHLRYQHGRYLDEDYKQAYGYGVSLHNRYGLIDYQDFSEENAGEDEIAVEA